MADPDRPRLENAPVSLVYYWIHHTGRYDGNSGVQRVVRALGAALAGAPAVTLVPVRWCAHRDAIVRAEPAWLDGLAKYSGPRLPAPADAGEPLHMAAADAGRLRGAWLLLPEVPHVGGVAEPPPSVPVALDYARYYGLRTAAIFYDLIPLRVPGYEAMRDAHADYARALAAVDLVLPISATAGRDLGDWWAERALDPRRLPPVRPLPLAAEMTGTGRVVEATPRLGGSPAAGSPAAGGPVRFLAVGSVEPRKNQLEVMRAVNRLRRRRPDLDIRLDVVGHIHAAVEADVRAEADASEGRIRLHVFLPDAAVRELTRACDATVFVSRAEGFGLPIVESLWQGRPCLCSDVGSMAEAAEGGGCLLVDPFDPAAIEAGLETLAGDADLRERLGAEARRKPLSRWDDYGRAVLDALASAPDLPRVAVIEGSRLGGETVARGFEGLGTVAHRLHWRPRSDAVLPGFRDGAAHVPAAGEGDLRDLWAVVPLSTCDTLAEAMRIEDEARGLGLRPAFAVEAGRTFAAAELMALAGADLVLFTTDAERDRALLEALRVLPKTATLRNRWRVAATARAMAAAIAAERPRIAVGAATRPVRRLFYWTGLTASQPFNTGIQRVVRSLGAALQNEGVDLVPVKWDEAAGAPAPLDADEAAVLARWDGPSVRAPEPLPGDLAGEWLLVPEVTMPVVPAGSNAARLAQRLGMRSAAIFFDLIPEKMTDIYPRETADAFAEYWALFAHVDVALPISWTVAADLRRHLAGRGLRVPPLVPCPLAGDRGGAPRRTTPQSPPAPGTPLRFLAVGTWEPRKNHLRVLRAFAAASRRVGGRAIELAVVGRRSGFAALDAAMEAIAAENPNLRLHNHLSDADLHALFEQSHATIFGSWEEGFGLPVLESVWAALPCLCHDGSAMTELAGGGGVLAVDMLDERAITEGIVRLANDEVLLDRLGREAVGRPIRDWAGYARDVLAALSRTGTTPGWPLPAVFGRGARPLLSCAVTTFNRAHWLRHTLPQLVEAARPFGAAVEIVVCDNTSTDDTPDVVARFDGTPHFVSRRNAVNVGMLGNLGATVRAANGAFVWLLGDDDLVVDGAIGDILEGLERHPDVEMAYLNYAYTNFDAPDQLDDPRDLVRTAELIGVGGPNRRVDHLRDVAALNENLFTAIYACAFRRDHALRAYGQDVRGAPFSTLLTCIPSSVYALAALQDRPAWWVGRPAAVINMNVSWLRWELLWRLERMPDLFDAAEAAGVDPVRVDRHRYKHCWNAGEWVRDILLKAPDDIRTGFSMARLIERCKHIEAFRDEVPALFDAYARAWREGRVPGPPSAPEAMFRRYGLL